MAPAPWWGDKVGLPTVKQLRVDQYLATTAVELDKSSLLTVLRCACGIFSIARRTKEDRQLPQGVDTNLADCIMIATCLKMLRKKRVRPEVWLGVAEIALQDMPRLPQIMGMNMHDYYHLVCYEDLDPLEDLRKSRGDEKGHSLWDSLDEHEPDVDQIPLDPSVNIPLPTMVNSHVVIAMKEQLEMGHVNFTPPHFAIKMDEHLLVQSGKTGKFHRTIHTVDNAVLNLSPNTEGDLMASIEAHWQGVVLPVDQDKGDIEVGMRCVRNQPDTIAIRLSGPVMEAKMNCVDITKELHPEGRHYDRRVQRIYDKYAKKNMDVTRGGSVLKHMWTDKWHEIGFEHKYAADVFGADLPGSNPDYVLVGILEEEGDGLGVIPGGNHNIWLHRPWLESEGEAGWCNVGTFDNLHKFPNRLETVPPPTSVVVGQPSHKPYKHCVLFYRNMENLRREEACLKSVTSPEMFTHPAARASLADGKVDFFKIMRNSPFCRSELYHVAMATMRSMDATENLGTVAAVLAWNDEQNGERLETLLSNEHLTPARWLAFKDGLMSLAKKKSKGPKQPPKPAPAPAPKPTKAEGKRAASQAQREVEKELEKARAEQAASLEAAAEARRAEEAKRVAEAHAAFQAKKAEQDAKAEAEAKAKDDAAKEAQKAKEARIAARRAAALQRKAEGKAERAGGPKKTAFQLQAEHEAAEKKAREDAEEEAIKMNAEREARQAAERERARAEQDARNAAAEARKARERAAKEAKREAAREAAKAKATEAAELAAAIKVAQVAEAEEAAAARARAERAARAEEEEAEVRRTQLARYLQATSAAEERRVGHKHGPECIVCFERARTHFGAVCGHMALCFVCADSMTTCPTCRVVTPFRRLYVV